jgi:hypothetical protein
VIKVATVQQKDKKENIKETEIIEGGQSAREERGVLKHDKHGPVTRASL